MNIYSLSSSRMLDEFPELLEINIMNIPLGEGIDPQLDMGSTADKNLRMMLASQSVDIFVFSKEDYEQFAKQGAFIPLEKVVDEEILQYGFLGRTLEDYKVKMEADPL